MPVWCIREDFKPYACLFVCFYGAFLEVEREAKRKPEEATSLGPCLRQAYFVFLISCNVSQEGGGGHNPWGLGGGGNDICIHEPPSIQLWERLFAVREFVVGQLGVSFSYPFRGCFGEPQANQELLRHMCPFWLIWLN